MLNLNQAIELAQRAHEGQWRRAIAIYPQEELTDYFESKGDNIIYDNYLITRDQAGWKKQQPYITHPLEVMEMMTTEEEKIVAVLHDVFENNENYKLLSISYKSYGQKWSKYTIETHEKHQIELSPSIWCALHSLTRQNGDWDKFKEKGVYQPYMGYIKDISLNKLATKVKLADIVCNLADNPSEHAKQKYLKAIPILLKGI